MLISVCIIAKDAEKYLRNAMDTALSFGGEVIIMVDSSSIDHTWALSTGYGGNTKVFEYDFVGFGAARNGLIREAKGDWILMLDTDETIDPEDVEIICKHLSTLQERIYTFPRKNWTDFGRMNFRKDFYPDRQSRLFPGGGKVNYGNQLVHEVPNGKGITTVPFPDEGVHINHFCFAYRKWADWHEVNQFYLKLGSQLPGIEPNEVP